MYLAQLMGAVLFIHFIFNHNRYVHVLRYVLGQNARSVQRYVHAPEQTYLIHNFFKFRGCLEAAIECTNIFFKYP